MSILYKEIIKSKTGEEIPLFYNDKAMHSKYAPVREAENFGNEIKTGSDFTIILGLGGGYHIASFLKKHPEQKIIVVEESMEDIDFLSQIECVKNILCSGSVNIISKEKLEESILNSYFPAVYGGINILTHRAWYDNNKNSADLIIETINRTLKIISSDYSVQSHFGFIWQKNIISNLKLISSKKFNTISFDTEKTAAIIAAGPSLDETVSILINKRNDFVIFATDTALSTLRKYNVKPDAVVSIDGQNISYKHFTGFCDSSTVFVFDLQSNFNAANYISTFSDNIIFTKSGHPFSNYAEKICSNNDFLEVDSGAGTVTIAAIDFAKKSGFTNFKVFGADFSYINSKPYAKGTYLDCLYRNNETKISPSENLFTNLLYRTEIKKENGIIKTEILDSYKTTFLTWIKNSGFDYIYEDSIYSISSKNKSRSEEKLKTPELKFNTLMLNLKAQSEKMTGSDFTDFSSNPLIVSLLPFISYLRNKTPSLTFSQAVKLALSKILEYT